MPYQPIENYGIIGNMRTVALIAMNGSIDWYSYPHFDSPSIFGAILDDTKGGRFQIQAVGEDIRYKQLYLPSTNILVTRFLLRDGIASWKTSCPWDFLRIHVGITIFTAGSVALRAHCAFRSL